MHPHCKCSSAPDVSDERAELEKMWEKQEKDFVVDGKDVQYRKNKRIGYASKSETFERNIGNKTIKIKATQATGTDNVIYISRAAKGNRKASIRLMDKLATQAFELFGEEIEGYEKPTIVIVAPSETRDGNLAGFVPSGNIIFRSDIKTLEDMVAMQFEDLAMHDHPLSTMVHELGHWYQYNKQIQQKPDATGEELRVITHEMDKEIIDIIHNKGYNIDDVTSGYASESFLHERYGEVFAELLVNMLLKDNSVAKEIFKDGKGLVK